MAIREPVVVPDGWRLVTEGLDENNRRDVTRIRYWRGLSAEEAYLLHRWVMGKGRIVQILHTDVPVGVSPYDHFEDLPAWVRTYAQKVHPLRIDAVAFTDGQWYVIEVKSDAGYVALGQVLTYGWYAVRTIKVLADAKLAVVTDKAQTCLTPVFQRFGVHVFEVGRGERPDLE